MTLDDGHRQDLLAFGALLGAIPPHAQRPTLEAQRRVFGSLKLTKWLFQLLAEVLRYYVNEGKDQPAPPFYCKLHILLGGWDEEDRDHAEPFDPDARFTPEEYTMPNGLTG